MRTATGGHTAVPIFEPIMQAVWAHVAPKTALAPPSSEARRLLACKAVDAETGRTRADGRERPYVAREGGKSLTECFRVDAKGRIADTQYRLTSGDGSYSAREGSAPAREPRHTTVRSYSAPSPQGLGSSYGWGWQNGGWYQQDQRRSHEGYQGGYGNFWNRW